MLDNDDLLSDQPHEKPAQCSVIAVASGKGGVGKTILSANLAMSFAEQGKQVVLFDADMGLANLDVVLNINSRYNLSHLLNGEQTLEDILCIGPMGVEVICGASGVEKLADLTEFERERLLSELDRVQNAADVLIIDTGAGIQKSVVSFCMAAHSVMVVTTPEPTAITDAYAMIKVLASQGYHGRINLVVNMASSLTEGKTVYRQISTVAMRFLDTAVYEAGIILKDELFWQTVKARKPVVLSHPRSKAARSITTLARRLMRTYEKESTRKGFFRKVVSSFF